MTKTSDALTATPDVLMVGTEHIHRVEVEAVAQAAGAHLSVVDVEASGEHYGTARLVLVTEAGAEAGAEAAVKANLVAGEGCLVVMLAHPFDTPTWELASAVDAEYVLNLAEGAAVSRLMQQMLYATTGLPFTRSFDAVA